MTWEILEQVAIVTGKILHQGTGKPVFGQVGITTEFGMVVDKLLKDGAFVISGRPDLLFPQLDSQSYQLNLRIRADSLQFRQGFIEKDLTVTIPSGWTFEQPVSQAETVFLDADAVNIGGYVFDAVNPSDRIANATIEILQEGMVIYSTLTSSDPSEQGKYRFNNIIVLAAAQIRCVATDFQTQTRNLLIDFGKSLNQENFYLVPSP
ncbi:MAG: hypothetical protein VKN72_07395 [Nostocales cyanobacterium 94392]|nr:hypothetical protein [Nostocales cyanobacterium 94392]